MRGLVAAARDMHAWDPGTARASGAAGPADRPLLLLLREACGCRGTASCGEGRPLGQRLWRERDASLRQITGIFACTGRRSNDAFDRSKLRAGRWSAGTPRTRRAGGRRARSTRSCWPWSCWTTCRTTACAASHARAPGCRRSCQAILPVHLGAGGAGAAGGSPHIRRRLCMSASGERALPGRPPRARPCI